MSLIASPYVYALRAPSYTSNLRTSRRDANFFDDETRRADRKKGENRNTSTARVEIIRDNQVKFVILLVITNVPEVFMDLLVMVNCYITVAYNY